MDWETWSSAEVQARNCEEKTTKWIESFKSKAGRGLQLENKRERQKIWNVHNDLCRLLKKNRKRRIESGKVSREKLKTKTALLNESKSYMVSSKFWSAKGIVIFYKRTLWVKGQGLDHTKRIAAEIKRENALAIATAAKVSSAGMKYFDIKCEIEKKTTK